MYKKLVALLAVFSVWCVAMPVMAQTDPLDVELSKAIDQHFAQQGLSADIITRIVKIEKELPEEFVEAYHQLQHKLAAQAQYKPSDVVEAFVAFVPVYNKYYLQDRDFVSLLRFSLFDIPMRTGWKEIISTEKLLTRLGVEYMGSGDAFEYRSAQDLQKMGVKDPLQAAIFADFAQRVLQAQYATQPAPAELYNAYVVLEQDLLQEESDQGVGVIKAFAKFAPAYLDFYAKNREQAVALSDTLFKEKLTTGWASRYHPTTVQDILVKTEIEWLGAGDAYRYHTAQELVKIYKKDKLTKEDSEMFVDVSVRVLKGKYYQEN